MSVKENVVGFQPGVESSVPFHLPEGKSHVDADVESDHVVVVLSGIFVGGVANAINILGKFFTRRDVAVHSNASKGRGEVSRSDSVLVVDILEVL